MIPNTLTTAHCDQIMKEMEFRETNLEIIHRNFDKDGERILRWRKIKNMKVREEELSFK